MEQTTQNTPAEVVYQPEAELPPITSLDDLSHIRAIDKQGRSVTMTPAQLAELVPYVGANIIHSKTEYTTLEYHNVVINDVLKAGDDLTLSFYAAGSHVALTRGELYFTYCDTNDVKKEMSIKFDTDICGTFLTKKIIKHVQVPADFARLNEYANEQLFIMLGNCTSIRVANIKLELGSKATPYIPNFIDTPAKDAVRAELPKPTNTTEQ